MGKNIIDDITSAVYIYLFIKFILPVLLVLGIICFGYNYFHGVNIRNEYKNQDNIIFSSKFNDVVSENAERLYNKDEFSEIRIDTLSQYYDIELTYQFKDTNKTADEYDELIKNEITKLYESLKNNKIIIDRFYEDKADKNISIKFVYKSKYIGFILIEYTDEKGFDEEVYQKEINRVIVTQDRIDSINKLDN